MAKTKVLAKEVVKNVNGNSSEKPVEKSKTPSIKKEIVNVTTEKPVVNLDSRIQQFEKLRGLANKREQLVQTLAELTRFNYNTGDATFMLQDSAGLHFKTGNTNLIKLVTSQLQSTLEERKKVLESHILAFELE